MTPERPAPLVAEGASFDGMIHFRGALRVDGSVAGSIHGTGILYISETAVVTGKITVDQLVLDGKLQGDVSVAKEAVLSPGSTLGGSLKAASLRLDEGASLSAHPLEVGSLDA
ncbi:MAG: polymer-forming cytoskeletal protein [Deltaproteobacteria bacterium]|nr:polymer-forming cytoskeletal protein [Deltaproteobacteria bacterium]